jgi:hemerythrin-like domain-containing protein
VACHGRIEERLEVLERAAEHLELRPEESRKALDSVFRYFDTSGAMHTADEEESVFPRLAPRLSAEERAYIEALENQHREADRLYQELRRVPPPGAPVEPYRQVVSRFCRLYREHIASENERLIAVGQRLLSEPDLAAISSEMKRRRALG